MKHLNLLSPNEIEATIIYILSLFTDADFRLLQKINNIDSYKFGEYVDNETKRKYIKDAIFDRIGRCLDFNGRDVIFLSILEGIFVYLPTDFIDQIKRRLSTDQSTIAQDYLKRIEYFKPF